MRPSKKNNITLCLIAVSVILTGCDSGGNDSPEKVASEPVYSNSVYSIWPTAYETSPNELGEVLKQNPERANEICNSDPNRPKGYKTHFAAMANHVWNRSDLIAKYSLDPNGEVVLGGTGILLGLNLESVIMQHGAVNAEDEVIKQETSEQLMRFTFSRDGTFSGYCEDTKGYTPVYRASPETGEMKVYSMSCRQNAGLVCMSTK